MHKQANEQSDIIRTEFTVTKYKDSLGKRTRSHTKTYWEETREAIAAHSSEQIDPEQPSTINRQSSTQAPKQNEEKQPRQERKESIRNPFSPAWIFLVSGLFLSALCRVGRCNPWAGRARISEGWEERGAIMLTLEDVSLEHDRDDRYAHAQWVFIFFSCEVW